MDRPPAATSEAQEGEKLPKGSPSRGEDPGAASSQRQWNWRVLVRRRWGEGVRDRSRGQGCSHAPATGQGKPSLWRQNWQGSPERLQGSQPGRLRGGTGLVTSITTAPPGMGAVLGLTVNHGGRMDGCIDAWIGEQMNG